MTDLSTITPAEALQKYCNAKEAFAPAARQFAEAYATSAGLKNLKSSMFQSISDKQSGLTPSERGRQTEASDEWKVWLDGLNAAIRLTAKLEAEKAIIETSIDFWKTFVYDKNTERRTNT